MVSNTLKLELEQLLGILERIRQDNAADPQYQELRAFFPADWPM